MNSQVELNSTSAIKNLMSYGIQDKNVFKTVDITDQNNYYFKDWDEICVICALMD